MNDLLGRTDGSLGVFFVRSGPAEVRQDPVTYVMGDESVISRNHIAAMVPICVQQATQFFRVEFFAQRGRAH
jgi:hypothetical protein